MVFDIWSEGFCFNEEEQKAQCLAKGVEGENFNDAVFKWYGQLQHPERYGELEYFLDGSLRIFGCRLYDNEKDARKRFG